MRYDIYMDTKLKHNEKSVCVYFKDHNYNSYEIIKHLAYYKNLEDGKYHYMPLSKEEVDEFLSNLSIPQRNVLNLDSDEVADKVLEMKRLAGNKYNRNNPLHNMNVVDIVKYLNFVMKETK